MQSCQLENYSFSNKDILTTALQPEGFFLTMMNTIMSIHTYYCSHKYLPTHITIICSRRIIINAISFTPTGFNKSGTWNEEYCKCMDQRSDECWSKAENQQGHRVSSSHSQVEMGRSCSKNGPAQVGTGYVRRKHGLFCGMFQNIVATAIHCHNRWYLHQLRNLRQDCKQQRDNLRLCALAGQLRSLGLCEPV
jgi:hypothetical protein